MMLKAAKDRRSPRSAAALAARLALAALMTLSALLGAPVGALAQNGELGFTPPPQPAEVEAAERAAESAPESATESARSLNGGLGARPAAAPAGDDWLGSALRYAAEGGLLLALAGAFGGFFGAMIGGRRGGAAAEAPARMERRAAPVRHYDDAEPALGLEPDFADPAQREPVIALPEPAGAPGRGEERALPAPQTLNVQEAERLLTFFRDRFDVETDSADGAIDYLTRLGASVESLRRKLSEAELELEDARAGAQSGDVETAPWDLLAEALRSIGRAAQTLRADPDYADLASEVQLEESLREFAALRSAWMETGARFEPELVEEAWPHALLRAEALTLSYYPTRDAWRDLRFGLALAAAALRALFRREGVYLEHVRLLSAAAPGEAEMWSDTSEGLRDLRPVAATVLAGVASDAAGLVLDCESFGYFDQQRELEVRSKVIVFNSAEWR